MKNLRKTKNAQIGYALPVPATASSGKCVKLGTAGLRGVCITDRATADTEFQVGGAVGLKPGEATVELIGVHTVVKVAFAAAIVQFAPVYLDAVSGEYTATSNSGANVQVGATLGALAGAGAVDVALF